MPASNYVGRTQQEAVAGIREMQNRMRDRHNDPRFRNWSTEPGIPHADRTPRRSEPEPPPPPEPVRAAPPPPQFDNNAYYHEEYNQPYYPPGPSHGPRTPPNGPRRNGLFPGLSNLFGGNYRAGRGASRSQQNEPGPRSYAPPPPPPRPEPDPPKDTTLLQDILNGIGLDDDRILILGLILILINDKADTTLILALLYLLL